MDSVYERLRERLDRFPQGYPKTASGVELEILEQLVTPEEAGLLLQLRPFPEAVSTLAGRTGRPVGWLGPVLEDLSRRGVILHVDGSGGEKYYSLMPWMIGIWEFQVKRLTPESVKLYETFYREGLVPQARRLPVAGFRVIPVERAITVRPEVQSYERVSEIVAAQTRLAVADCICRKEAKLAGGGCDRLMEACLVFGDAAAYYIDNGFGREIGRAEALAILDRTEADGLVHFSTNHVGEKGFICNCCGCCCKGLGFLTQHRIATFIAPSRYRAEIDHDRCEGCGACAQRCPVQAIDLSNGGADAERCIGCGLCCAACGQEAVHMLQRPGAPPPEYRNELDLFMAGARARNIEFPFF
jgi:ferredoxin